MKINDGRHDLRGVRRDLTSVVVTPILLPKYFEPYKVIKLMRNGKMHELSLSFEDADKVVKLVSRSQEGDLTRTYNIKFTREYGGMLRISVTQ